MLLHREGLGVSAVYALQSLRIRVTDFSNCSRLVRGARHSDVHRSEPQAGGDGAQGAGGVHQDRAYPRRVTQDVRATLRRD